MKKLSCLFFTILFLYSTSHGMDQESIFTDLVNHHEKIKSYQNDVESAKFGVRQAKGLYYPQINIVGDAGKERVERQYAATSTENRYDASVKLSQLITDFGSTSGRINHSELVFERARASLEAVKQEVLLNGIKAYISLVKARDKLNYTENSEARIKELTGIEETLVRKSAGLTSNVLQVKSRLLGARALKNQAETELKIAVTRFNTVFNQSITIEEAHHLNALVYPETHLILDPETAVQIAIENNPRLQAIRINSTIAESEISTRRSAFYPQFSLFGEAVAKDNDEGIEGYRREYSCGVEFRYNLLNGGRDTAAVKSAQYEQKAALSRLDYASRQIKEQVYNTLDQFYSLQEQRRLLEAQSEICQAFLDVAKKEKKMGTRPLLDVLSGELNLIEAQSHAVTARKDGKLLAYELLYVLGRMTTNSLIGQ